jgi:hypothetical protein
LLELDRTDRGNYHLPATPWDFPLAAPLAAVWLAELNIFLNRGICSGCPQGLAYDVRISSMPEFDPVIMQQFALSVLDRLTSDLKWTEDTADAIGSLAIEMDLAHTDPVTREFQPGPLHKGPREDDDA